MEANMDAPVIAEALGDPWSIPIDQIDVSDSRLFQDDVWPDWFARLRRDDPVHFIGDSQFGPYWSVTKYKDIMKVETNPQVFSSVSGWIRKRSTGWRGLSRWGRPGKTR